MTEKERDKQLDAESMKENVIKHTNGGEMPDPTKKNVTSPEDIQAFEDQKSQEAEKKKDAA